MKHHKEIIWKGKNNDIDIIGDFGESDDVDEEEDGMLEEMQRNLATDILDMSHSWKMQLEA